MNHINMQNDTTPRKQVRYLPRFPTVELVAVISSAWPAAATFGIVLPMVPMISSSFFASMTLRLDSTTRAELGDHSPVGYVGWRILHGVPERPIARLPPRCHSRQHWNGKIGVVVDDRLALGLVFAMQPADGGRWP